MKKIIYFLRKKFSSNPFFPYTISYLPGNEFPYLILKDGKELVTDEKSTFRGYKKAWIYGEKYKLPDYETIETTVRYKNREAAECELYKLTNQPVPSSLLSYDSNFLSNVKSYLEALLKSNPEIPDPTIQQVITHLEKKLPFNDETNKD